MLCRHNARISKRPEEVKCSDCQSGSDLKCVHRSKDQREGGDNGYQWRCAVCQSVVAKLHNDNTNDISFLKTVTAINEKFDLVNKFQLPKLSSDLMQIKSATDRLAEQCQFILRKIEQLEDSMKNISKPTNKQSQNFRKRNLCVATKSQKLQNVTSTAEKPTRCRPRRRCTIINKISLLFHKNLRETSPKSKNK